MANKLDIKESPSRIWNLDESGFQDHFVPKKAVGEKGLPLYQVKGETVTVLPVFNALGDWAGNDYIQRFDRHASHIYNVEFPSLMKEHGVEVVCLAPHCTHWMQPADKALFRAMKSNWEVR